MRIRHKPPTLVSMWMLDVFCCALGCVTLLFLFESRKASDAAVDQQAAAAKLQIIAAQLEDAEKRLQLALTEKEGLRLQLEQANAKSVKLDEAIKELQRRLAVVKGEKDALGRQRDELSDRLQKVQKDAEQLAKRVQDAQMKLEPLLRLQRQKDAELQTLARQNKDLKQQLDDLDAHYQTVQADLDKALREKADTATKLEKAQNAMQQLRQTIVDLQAERQRLLDKLLGLQQEQDKRFAGIITAGQRVVFIVDISGSMGKKDTNTPDPDKWRLVVDTVGRVMRSVADMKQYQVVIFSSRARWLFDDNGAWRDYLGEKSIQEVTEALKKVQPHDDTNLYAAFELAFSLRESGLDTIYLFSDGLPTSGPGLTPQDQARVPALSEVEIGQKLGQHLRQTIRERWNAPQANRQKVRIHSVGFYFDSPDLGAFLWALARENDGSFVGMSKP